MSIAGICSSLPAVPFGFKDGRGTRDMVHIPSTVRQSAKPPAQACRLIRWNKHQSAVVPTNSSLSPSPIHVDIPTNPSLSPSPIHVDIPTNPSLSLSPTSFDVGIALDLDPFLIKHLSGRIERLGRFGDTTDYVEGSLVISKDVIIDTETQLSVRIYLPQVESPPKKLPVVVYFHGGAFIVEDTASPPYHNYLNKLAEKANILIVSVNYRLAPEFPLPVAYEDCMAALNWVDKHSGGKGQEDWINKHGDFKHLFISGDSAGGNITHNLAMRDDNNVDIEGIALVHPYFFGSVPVPTELEDPTNLLFHRKLWPFIAPDSEGLDDPRVNPLGPAAPSLEKLKCKRAVVFVAGKDFHAERGKLYTQKLKREFKGETPELCNHDGVGHVYHLSVDAADEKKESEAARKTMIDLLNFYKDNEVALEPSVVESLEAKTEEAIENMIKTGRKMSDRMMTQLIAFYKGEPVPFSS